MGKPGPKSGGNKDEQREKESAKTLWFLAGKGNKKAQEAIGGKTGKGGKGGK
jgi:hypothetical protein